MIFTASADPQAVATALGKMTFEKVGNAPWFDVVLPFHFGVPQFHLVPILTKAEVEGSLLDELARHLGKRPNSATCPGNLEGKSGNTVDCAVTAGPERAAPRG